VKSFYGALRDAYLPGKPIWLTETAQAVCGGDKWAAARAPEPHAHCTKDTKAGVSILILNTDPTVE